jgi:hypothetical protein
MRLAYAGSTPLIIEEVRYRAVLTVPRRRDQIRLWILRVRALLENDLEGLTTVEGPLRPTKTSPRLRRALFAVCGIIMMPLATMFFLHPILLIGLLLLGPPEELKVLLVAGDKQIDLECLNARGDCKRPFLVQAGSVGDYVMRCKLHASRQRFGTTRFSGEISVAYVDDTVEHLKWHLPRSGHMIWQVEEKLEVVVRGRLVPHTVALGRGAQLVRIAPQASESVEPARRKTSRGVKPSGRGKAPSGRPKC